MIDTLKLMLGSYHVAPGNNLTVQPASYIEGSGRILSEYPLWRKPSGAVVKGSKAFYNSEHINLTIAPLKESGVQAFVKFSVPKIYYGDNYYSTGREGTQAVLGIVERELLEAGIETDIQEASLSRIDTCATAIMEEAFPSYAPIFSLLNGSRQQRRDYGTTFLWENSQIQQCIYDKNREAENRGIAPGTYPAQSMRAEYRLLNKRKIESTLGFSSVGMLPNQWDLLKDRSRQAWSKLFRFEPGEFEIMASRQLSLELSHFRDKYGRNYLDYYLKAVGALSLVSVAGIETLRSALQELEEDRLKVYRAVKKLEQAKAELELLREEPVSRKTLSTLYQELREKIYLN